MSSYAYLTHTTTQGDRWDLISWTYYGDVNHIPTLMAANPDVALDPILAEGVSIQVPIIDEPDPDTTPGLPPWRS
jgi:phage tail protein X